MESTLTTATEETSVKYSIVHYDVKDGEKINHDVYQVIYKHLHPIAIQLSGSVYYFNAEKGHLLDVAFSKINAELERKKKRPVLYGVVPVDASGYEAVREWSKKTLREKAQDIAASLLKSVERLDGLFHGLIDDPNVHVKKKQSRLSYARRALEQARGLAAIFAMEAEVEDAMEASELILNAQREVFGELKDTLESEGKLD